MKGKTRWVNYTNLRFYLIVTGSEYNKSMSGYLIYCKYVLSNVMPMK